MNLFIDKNHRRKSPIAIAGFFATLLDLCIYGVLYTLLAEPLYRQLTLPSTAATNAVHTLIIALAGTAIGSLLFLLRDKRVALFGFVGLAVVLVMFYFAAWMLDTDQRATMVQLITLYGVAPALIGNAVAWPVYLKLRKTHPLPVQKTLQEEMREAAGTKADAAPKAHPAAPAAEERPRRSPQEDAMLLFEGRSFIPGKSKYMTLGTMTAVRGLALLISDGKPIIGISESYKAVAASSIFGIPMLAVFLVITILLCSFVLSKTVYGRRVYACGGNLLAAQVSGINTTKIRISTFAIAGLLAGLSGFLMTSRVTIAQPTAAESYEMDAITACVVGGVSMTGGVGKPWGVVIGCLLITVIANGLDIMGVSSHWQKIVKGAIIVLAVLIDVKGKSKKR